MNNKDTGSFYTPENLIQFMVAYIRNRIRPKSILEPSAGDGRFVKYLTFFGAKISLIEFDKMKAQTLEGKYGNSCNVSCSDFIKYARECDYKYDLIIGNPPYIAKKSIPTDQYSESERIAEFFKTDKSILQNLWVSFVLSALKLLSDNGAIFFVLPFEFLQVQYAEKLRNFLETKFNTIEIITFEERIFEGIEQDICLVYLANESEEKPYIQYTTFVSAADSSETFKSIIKRNKPLKKWSNCILDDEETDNFMRLAALYPRVSTFGDISPGIVTGANSFFILPQAQIKQLAIPDENILPIITKSSKIPPLLLYSDTDFASMISSEVPTHLLNLTDLKDESFSVALKDYIKTGETKKLHEGFKCKNRNRWYDVPIVKNGQVCFFKRFHELPRVLINKANVYTTDIVYNIRFNDAYDADSFAFCFYNSLTLALCEYYGRFYGGGVGELVPKEFKELPIPYQRISEGNIKKLDMLFRTGVDSERIIDFVDGVVLDKISSNDKKLLQNIRKKYIERRMKIRSRRIPNEVR